MRAEQGSLHARQLGRFACGFASGKGSSSFATRSLCFTRHKPCAPRCPHIIFMHASTSFACMLFITLPSPSPFASVTCGRQ